MSKTKQFVRFTFYWKLLWQSLAIAMVIFEAFNHKDLAWYLTLAFFFTYLAGTYIVSQRFGVNLLSAKQSDYIADERDAAIAEKVNLTMKYNRDHMAFSLIIVGMFVFNPMNDTWMKVLMFVAYMIMAMIFSNVEYYYLWNKFDKD